MEKNLLISVIIPMYNSTSTIVSALDSVKNQTLKVDYEVIVVNDGSTDDSLLIVEDYKNNTPELNIVLLNQKNGGVSAARNAGLKIAKGNYIAFLDSDDVWVAHKISTQISFLLDSNVDFVCALRNDEKITFPYKVKFGYAEISLKKLLLKVIGQTSTALFKRIVLDNTGYFDENQKYSEDANFWMRISKNNYMIVLDEMLVKTNNDYAQKGLSSNLEEMHLGVLKNIKEMYFFKRINFFEYFFYIVFEKIKMIKRL
ncbi:hypothetical protein BWK58_14315 [Flavobacterium columnare]|nr:hypothetical protein BWK58_14315 [Flavobacterium columnare]